MRRLLLVLVVALAGCKGTNQARPPAAPANVSATAGDGRVTVIWDAAPDALGYKVFQQDGAAATVASPFVDEGAATSYSATGLTNGHAYHFAVAATNAAGQSVLSADVTATPAANAPLSVAATVPADGATGVARNAPIAVTFSKQVQAGTVTASASGTACSGSVQISADGFVTCAALGAPVSSDGGATFTFAPAAVLPGAATFRIKVTTAVKDLRGFALPAETTSAVGFTTKSALLVQGTLPTGANAALLPAIWVNFNVPVLATTLTTTTTGTSCGGSIEVSADAFATCATMSSLALSGQTATLVLAGPLLPNTAYSLRVSTAVQDADGVPLDAAAVSTFNTGGALAVISSSPASGAVNVPQGSALSVSFSVPPLASTVVAGLSTVCAGTLQLSSDSFDHCVPMNAQPVASNSAKTFTLTPASPLAAATRYQLKVTTGAQDASGAPLAAEFVASFLSGPPLAVSATNPSAGAQGVALNAPLSITFNRAPDLATVTSSTCMSAVTLSSDNLATCVPLTASGSGPTFTFAHSALLNTGTIYKLQVSTAVKDANAVPLGTAFSASFVTEAPFAVASVSPPDNSTGVALSAAVSITFNRAASALTTNTLNATCSGSFQLSAVGSSGCVVMIAPTSTDGVTWTVQPAANLAPSPATYSIRITGAQDAAGVPLAAVFNSSFKTGTTPTQPPPGPVTNVTSLPGIHGALSWTNPTDANFGFVRIYSRIVGASVWPTTFFQTADKTVTSAQLALAPGKSYEYLLTTVNTSGNEQLQGNGVQANSNGPVTFAAAATEWLFGESATGDAGNHFHLSWNESELFAAIDNAGHAPLDANNGDALWIAIDTDPDADVTGEVRTITKGVNEIIWPFKADYVISLQPASTSMTQALCTRVGGPVICLHQAGTTGFSLLNGASGLDGANASAVRLPAAALGSPGSIRVAFAAVATMTGYTFDLSPRSASGAATNTLRYWASETASFGTRAATFGIGKFSTALAAAAIEYAPGLVSFSIKPPSGATQPLTLIGSLHPLDDGTGTSQYQLGTDGLGNSVGGFNFGGQTGELRFDIASAGTYEFATGKDRYYTLSGGAEAIPQLTYGVSYDSQHTFALVFSVTSGGTPIEIRGNVAELGNFSTAGAAVTGPGPWTATVQFGAGQSVDLTQGTGLQFKLYYPDHTYEGNGKPNSSLDDDVINTRTLSWTAGTPVTF